MHFSLLLRYLNNVPCLNGFSKDSYSFAKGAYPVLPLAIKGGIGLIAVR